MESPFPPQPSIPFNPPAAPKVFGVLNTGSGAFGLISMLMTWQLYFGPLEDQTGVNAELLRSNSFYAASMRYMIIPGMIVAALQVTSGIGLFKYREWARKVALACAAYSLLQGIFISYLSFVHTVPFTIDYTLSQSPEAANPQFEQMMRVIMKAAMVVGTIIGLLFPVSALFFLTRPRVRVHCIAASTKPSTLIA